VDRWLDALSLEAERAGEWQPFDTLYIGGGTPSSLNPKQMERLFAILRERFIFAPGLQTTLEANPADIDRHLAGRLADLGVNRLSLGAQSFDDSVLGFLGRRHSSDDIGPSCDTIREAGIAQLSLDLISAIPGQPLYSWLESLDRAVALKPQHLSCYQLSIEAGTPLFIEGIEPVSDEEAAEVFLEGDELLEQAGYQHYEVSNFARGAQNRSLHNVKYWTHMPYLGLGPSAHSFDGSSRWWNDDSLDLYCGKLEGGESTLAGRETLSGEQLAMDGTFFCILRGESMLKLPR